MKTLLKIGLVVFVSILFLISFLLALLVYSPQFNSWLVLQAANLVPEVSIDKVDGVLLGEMQLHNFSYRSEQVDVNIDSIVYRYKLANLFDKHVLFESLQASGVDVVLKESSEPEDKKTLS